MASADEAEVLALGPAVARISDGLSSGLVLAWFDMASTWAWSDVDVGN